MTLILEQTLQKRLDESNITKETQLARIKELQTDLQNKLKKIPKRPRETIKELEARAKDLEYKRTVTSVSLAEERSILKEINAIKKGKVQVEEFNKMDEEVKTLKKKLHTLRDELSEIFISTDEIQMALEKVKLANKLECGTDEISKKEMDCPEDRVGMVIGKNGSMMKQIQDTHKVSIEVDQDTRKITITGNDAAIQRAMEEIERIIHIEEEEIPLEPYVSNYCTSKYVDVIQKLREEYANAFIDVSRHDKKLVVRGAPADVGGIKAKIFGMDIVWKEKKLTTKEAHTILGKKGATIDRLCSDHSISIEVEKVNNDESIAVFTGTHNEIEAAMSEIEDLLNDNEEVVDFIYLSRIQKDILLGEGGRHIKAFQARIVEAIPDGHCYLSVNKDFAVKDDPEMLIRAKQSFISEAREFACGLLKEIDELFVEISVDPYVIPRIIGKGGETVKKICGGKPAFLEVDGVSGDLSYGATTMELLEELRKKVDEIIDINSIVRIPADPAIIKRQFRELNRSGVKNDLDGCWLDMDDRQPCYILRGKKQDIEKGKILLEEFIANTQFGEVAITDEDREALTAGGKKGKIWQLSEEGDVHLQIDRTRFCVVISGSKENVKETAEKLNQYLRGGNGYSVEKLSVDEQVVGKIIGRGGHTRQELEGKYGVKIHITRSHVVTIRGPCQAVADCRVEVGKIVASARITQTVTITEEQKLSLEKKDYTKKIHQQMPVHLTSTDEEIVVRGAFFDVRDAVSLLNEMMTGEYKISIELDASQFAKVRNAARDPSHFERMEAECGATVELDLSAGSISISGKRANVKRAKDQVYAMLDFIIPKELKRIKITKPLYISVGQASALAEISAEAGGVSIYLDRDLSLVVVRSSNEENVQKAADLVKEKIEEAERLAYVFEVSALDSWILPVLIGKKGGNIARLRSKYPSCKIDISKESRTVTVVGECQENVKKVREAIGKAIEKARSENLYILIPNTYVPSFLGKTGSHVKELTARHGVNIQRVKKGDYNFRISGEEEKVKSTKKSIDDWLAMRDKANGILKLHLERDVEVAVILGPKGSIVHSIEEDYNCKIDVDKKMLAVIVRAENEDQREAAVGKMKGLIEKHRKDIANRHGLAKEKKGNTDQVGAERDTETMKFKISEPIDVPERENGGPTNVEGIASKPERENGDLDVRKVEENGEASQSPTNAKCIDSNSEKENGDLNVPNVEENGEASQSPTNAKCIDSNSEKENGDLNVPKVEENGETSQSPTNAKCIDSNSEKENGNLDVPKVEENSKASQSPTNPVGIASKPSKHRNGKKKKVDVSIDEGTEAGKSLFALLMSEE